MKYYSVPSVLLNFPKQEPTEKEKEESLQWLRDNFHSHYAIVQHFNTLSFETIRKIYDDLEKAANGKE